LNKNVDYSVWKELINIEQDKMYQSLNLFEITISGYEISFYVQETLKILVEDEELLKGKE